MRSSQTWQWGQLEVDYRNQLWQREIEIERQEYEYELSKNGSNRRIRREEAGEEYSRKKRGRSRDDNEGSSKRRDVDRSKILSSAWTGTRKRLLPGHYLKPQFQIFVTNITPSASDEEILDFFSVEVKGGCIAIQIGADKADYDARKPRTSRVIWMLFENQTSRDRVLKNLIGVYFPGRRESLRCEAGEHGKSRKSFNESDLLDGVELELF